MSSQMSSAIFNSRFRISCYCRSDDNMEKQHMYILRMLGCLQFFRVFLDSSIVSDWHFQERRIGRNHSFLSWKGFRKDFQNFTILLELETFKDFPIFLESVCNGLLVSIYILFYRYLCSLYRVACK